MIGEQDIALTRHCLEYAQEHGAQSARATLTRSVENIISTLDAAIDNITHCEDNSLEICLFVDGKYGNFSTNDLGKEALEDFIAKAIDTVRMLAPDPCRKLPEKERCCAAAITGDELEIYDPQYPAVTPELRRSIALKAAVFPHETPQYRLVSEEGEYSDTLSECYVADTQGLHCLHRETNYDYGVEVTIEDKAGNLYSGYWWDSSERIADFAPYDCGRTALDNAASQIGAHPVGSGKYNMVISSDVASKVVSPLLSALNGYSLQQNNSFLQDSLGKKVFSEGLTIVDRPHIKGNCNSKLFDSEGVATIEGNIVENGVVRKYLLNTYMAAKLGMTGTVECATRPCVMPWPREGLDRNSILEMCGSGILVTEFNGGNCNTATGDFSYGVEGLLFEEGKIVKPVSGMIATGNMLKLWAGFKAAGSDARRCMSKLIPTLAFSDVDFSGE